jgi:subtilisin family serine protease
LILRTHQHVRLRVGPRGRIEGGGGETLERTLRDAGVMLSPLCAHPRGGAHQAVADLGCYFVVHAGGRAPDPVVADLLREQSLVEFAYPKLPVALPSAPAADDLRGGQGYLDHAPGGIGARAAWERPGGRGAGVRLIDVEAGWRFTHQDLGRHGVLAGGRPTDDVTGRNHGTNVLGMLLGVHDDRGVDGICPETAVRAVSYQPEERWGSARAIAFAANGLRPGDILLVEMQRPGPRAVLEGTSQDGYLPMSYWPDDLTAMQYATGRGVIVVEAAGNGAENLDHRAYGGKLTRGTRDSGAIMVGAGGPPREGFEDRARLDFSNYGSRVDVQGWGRKVATVDYGDLQSCAGADASYTDRHYTGEFAGTSSASPIVAGAAILLESYAKQHGRVLSPHEVRDILTHTGTPQTANASQRIGPRPDLARALLRVQRYAEPLP